MYDITKLPLGVSLALDSHIWVLANVNGWARPDYFTCMDQVHLCV